MSFMARRLARTNSKARVDEIELIGFLKLTAHKRNKVTEEEISYTFFASPEILDKIEVL